MPAVIATGDDRLACCQPDALSPAKVTRASDCPFAVQSIGVTVNTVTPGYVNTEMVEAVPEKVLEKIKGQIPMSRLANPDEIARVVHFLCADKSSYITGQIWGVNGGMDM